MTRRVVRCATLFGFEPGDGQLHHVAQPGALALREVADRVADIFGGVAVALEDGFVDQQRVPPGIPVLQQAVGKKGVVENQGQLLVGDDRVTFASRHEGRNQEGEQNESCHGCRLFLGIML